ncbi:PD-(D/E)XK nuclease-like domain-containing protein [Lactiplantibacillus plantarum]|uniref:PD-(D/E)XK nuclease-like domain-containing protein n=1 Tax=Lactiplantibacillus plantarum TaxID=1590 RepID=UPI0029CA0D44|nr:PD-(D/E)XK nuclease-like domain-containing protein [Lactiplantibacillus plantarum]
MIKNLPKTTPTSKTCSTTSAMLNRKLTPDNYYENWTDQAYMSPTMFKRFLACESEAFAELRGKWEPLMNSTALVVGNWLHSYFESQEAHAKFVDEHPEAISSRGPSKGHLKKDFKIAESMIEALSDDHDFNLLYQGQKEVIVTGEIGGYPWKGKIDCLNLKQGYFVDLKTTKDIYEGYWNPEIREREPFVYAYNYQLQMAVYQELIKQQFGIECKPYIVAVSKQEPPDKQAIDLPDYRLANAMNQVLESLPHIEEVIKGGAKPTRCERCDYCRYTKDLDSVVSADDLLER